MNQTLERMEAAETLNAVMAVEEVVDKQDVQADAGQIVPVEHADVPNWRQAGRHALMNTRALVQKREQAGLYMRTSPARDAGAERLSHMRRAPR